MSNRFWAFECMFAANNNLLMAEVFVGATRKELVAAMSSFFAVPRAEVLLAELVGAWFMDGGTAGSFFDVTPFVRVAIAGEELPFEEAERLVGDLSGGGLSRQYLACGLAAAEDAEEADEEDDADPELKPFELLFDAEGFLGLLPETDGEPLPPGCSVELSRPRGATGYPRSPDDEYFHGDVVLGPGWWDAEPGEKPTRFSPSRWRPDLTVPLV